MTVRNPFAIHQKLSLANVKFQKIMTNDTYISNYIYIYHHLYTFLTTDFHINFPRLHLRQLGKLVGFFNGEDGKVIFGNKTLGNFCCFLFYNWLLNDIAMNIMYTYIKWRDYVLIDIWHTWMIRCGGRILKITWGHFRLPPIGVSTTRTI